MNELKNKIEKLNVSESINFEYRLRDYQIKCYNESIKTGEKIFGISLIEGVRSNQLMNVSKITNKYISLYSYNMMSQESKYKMDISKITMIKTK